MITGGGPGGP
ncbi:hypothetical protein Tco_1266952, partial [Tanacetum coccineum]